MFLSGGHMTLNSEASYLCKVKQADKMTLATAQNCQTGLDLPIVGILKIPATSAHRHSMRIHLWTQ